MRIAPTACTLGSERVSIFLVFASVHNEPSGLSSYVTVVSAKVGELLQPCHAGIVMTLGHAAFRHVFF